MGNSYERVLKSTGMVAAGRIAAALFAIVNSKILAIKLGASGLGVYALILNAMDMLACFFGIGLAASGVRRMVQLTETSVPSRMELISLIIVVMGVSSAVGTLLTLLFCRGICEEILGTPTMTWMIAASSLYILFKNMGEINIAVLNGLRKIASLVKAQVLGALFGSILLGIFVVLLLDRSIPFCLLSVAAATMITSIVQLRAERIRMVRIPMGVVVPELKILLGLGICLLCSVLAMQTVGCMEKAFLRTELGYDWLGIYQSCWLISNSYVGIILVAMGVDYLPRLSLVVDDREKVRKCMNEQLELGLALAGIGVATVYLFAPLGLRILYAEEFVKGSFIIRWQVIGVLFRVIAFPMSYYLIAKGRGLLYVFVQLVFFAAEYLCLVLVVKSGGSAFLGLNYPLAYSLYVVMNFLVVFFSVGYRPSKTLLFIFLQTLFFLTPLFVVVNMFSVQWAYCMGSCWLVLYAAHLYRNILVRRFAIDPIQLVKARCRK